MKIIVCDNYEQASEKANSIVREVLTKSKQCVLGLATGSTPVGLYKYMVADYNEGKTTYKDVKTFNLDEYAGLSAAHPESYISFMRRNLFSHINIDEKNINIPDGNAPDLNAECARYNKLLDKHVRDIQILGIGSNGHIAFNEPGTAFDSVTHTVKLKESTIKDNARFFNNISEVPTMAVSMGISNIMAAKKIILIATGSNKKDAVKKMLHGAITVDCPASILQKHNDAVIILDKDAAT